MITSKSRKKYDTTKALVIKQLAQRYEYSADYVRKCINGDRESEVADEIKKEYHRLYKAISNALK